MLGCKYSRAIAYHYPTTSMSYTLSELAPIPKPITTKSHPTVARTKKGIATCRRNGNDDDKTSLSMMGCKTLAHGNLHAQHETTQSLCLHPHIISQGKIKLPRLEN